MTIRHLGIALLCLAVAGTAGAAPNKKSAKKDTSAAASTDAAKKDAPAASGVTETDIIGSKEAPGVSNIVPWKEKAVVIPKREVNTSILRETLQPLDRDVLRREIELKEEISKQ